MAKGDFLYKIDLGLQFAAAQERAEFRLEPETPWPTYSEIESVKDLQSANSVVDRLRNIHWGFEDEDTQFLTHDLHPYPAKFVPQIPGNLIAQLSLRGELVLDPFGGSGTTALEAIRLGRRALSVDANPIGTLIGRVKTCNLDRASTTDLHGIRSALTSLALDMQSPEQLCNTYREFVPAIANIDKWFPLSSRGELALIASRIAKLESAKAKDVASLALSKIVLGASFQDSETRYSSKPRTIAQGETVRRFISALDAVVRNVAGTRPILRYGVREFTTADIKRLREDLCRPNSVDLIVTSPPYGNANDYHLYHRFRLLWLGFDPIALGKIEIGSHLRHQKEDSGFDHYLEEMHIALEGMHRVLRPGRYAVLVVGDAVYEGQKFSGAESLAHVGSTIGFESVCIIERNLHRTKRSFTVAGRRATSEKLLVLRKAPKPLAVSLLPPPYKLWPYEEQLRQREIQILLEMERITRQASDRQLTIDPYAVSNANRLVFTHGVQFGDDTIEHTWQRILENGFATQKSARKDPKYVTHGLHPYKGKFYPQLAKGLINLTGLRHGSKILDPFCGSGTTLLESYLNGYQAFGCDMHPLAAKIAKAKIAILEADPDVFHEVVGTLASKLAAPPRLLPANRDEFHESAIDELERWFPAAVLNKTNWLLKAIRAASDGVIRDFLEMVLSGIVREISQQDPSDLRIRKRRPAIRDAKVFDLYSEALNVQCQRIERFWSVRGHCPARFIAAKVIEGDSRDPSTFEKLGLSPSTVDLILTSPPYATALPYIDTDRLSLLMLFGLDSSARRPLEHGLSGSREITNAEKARMLQILDSRENPLPGDVVGYLMTLASRVSKADLGFRRDNMPALLTRFFLDMQKILEQCTKVLKPGGEAMIVIGDNRMRVRKNFERIPTTDLIAEIAVQCGLVSLGRLDISVTKEDYLHMKNAITQNAVLRFRRPKG